MKYLISILQKYLDHEKQGKTEEVSEIRGECDLRLVLGQKKGQWWKN